jgi:hypothetical protein
VDRFGLREPRYFINPLPQQDIRRGHDSSILAQPTSAAVGRREKLIVGALDYTNASAASYVFTYAYVARDCEARRTRKFAVPIAYTP